MHQLDNSVEAIEIQNIRPGTYTVCRVIRSAATLHVLAHSNPVLLVFLHDPIFR